MRICMNTALSGSGRADGIESHPESKIRGLTKLVKITEEQAIQVGLKQKAREFAEKGSELYIS
jgi:hypothetical protein